MTEIELAPLIERLREAYIASLGSHQERAFLTEAADKLEALSRVNAWQYERLVETQMLAHKWMEAHDKLKAGKPYDFPKPADLPETVEALSGRISTLENALKEAICLVPTSQKTALANFDAALAQTQSEG